MRLPDVLKAAVLAAAFPAAAAWVLLSSGRADGEPTDFVRFVEGEPGEGKLETALVSYEGPKGVKVDLIAAVHVADGAYYKDLQQRFEGYDALLYEMIKPADVELKPGEGSGGILGFFQRGLKDVLGLEFQLDAVDYRQKNFIHADLDPETFFRLQSEKGESIVGFLFKVMLKDLERQMRGDVKHRAGMIELLAAFSSKDSSRRLKLLFARELEDMEAMLAGIESGKPGEESVILAERNKAALKALSEALEKGKKKVGIFYGGAHMPDMERRLDRDFGLKKSRAEWLTAWDIRRKDSKPAAGAAGPEGEKKEEKVK
jgi:hypothetical protein